MCRVDFSWTHNYFIFISITDNKLCNFLLLSTCDVRGNIANSLMPEGETYRRANREIRRGTSRITFPLFSVIYIPIFSPKKNLSPAVNRRQLFAPFELYLISWLFDGYPLSRLSALALQLSQVWKILLYKLSSTLFASSSFPFATFYRCQLVIRGKWTDKSVTPLIPQEMSVVMRTESTAFVAVYLNDGKLAREFPRPLAASAKPAKRKGKGGTRVSRDDTFRISFLHKSSAP